MKTSRTVGQRKGSSQKIMKTTMATKPKVHFDPKVNFELPSEIGPLLEQTVSVSVAESIDASFELSLATQNAVADFETQFSVV